MVPATASSELPQPSGRHVTVGPPRWCSLGQRCRYCGAGTFRSARTRRKHERTAHERRVHEPPDAVNEPGLSEVELRRRVRERLAELAGEDP